MKVSVTHLKAPWPDGATVGSIVDFEGDKMPAWAVGKCRPAPDDAAVIKAGAKKPEPDGDKADPKKPKAA